MLQQSGQAEAEAELSLLCLGLLVQAPMFAEFPQLVGKVLFSELGTPLSSEHYLGTPYSYGLAHTPGKTQRLASAEENDSRLEALSTFKRLRGRQPASARIGSRRTRRSPGCT